MQLLLITEGQRLTIFSLEIGDSVSAFLENLQQDGWDEYCRALRRLEHLAESGASRRRDHFNSLGDGIFESKTRRGTRIIFFYDKEEIVICAVGFKKKAKKHLPICLQLQKNVKKLTTHIRLQVVGLRLLYQKTELNQGDNHEKHHSN